nr:hypothetical protein [Halobacillus shinanisalinarum]
MEMLQRVQQAKVIPVIREATGENILPIARALYNGGITAIEITAETPDVEMLIKEVRSNVDDMIVGAGQCSIRKQPELLLWRAPSLLFRQPSTPV